MALKLSANYSKKLGLPQFSSHSFSASVEVELTDISQVAQECHRLYELLQHSVDQEIQNTGFIPTGNGHSGNGNGRTYAHNGGAQSPTVSDRWNCTEGQRGMILRIVNENGLEKNEVENLSQQLFGIGVKALNKLQASQLIEDLLVKVGKPAGRSRWRPQPQSVQS